MLILISRGWRLISPLRAVLFALLLSSVLLMAQSSPGTGAIRGLVSDPKGVPVSGAKVTFINKRTGTITRVLTSATGDFSSGPLQQGDYKVDVAATNSKTEELEISVRVAVISSADVKMQPGKETEIDKIVTSEGLVNTQQPTVQTNFPADLIEILPVSGRTYLGIAELAPGVQLVDAGTLDARKLGVSTASIQGQSGRGTRFELDGVSISDEISGTTTQNIPAGAIREFNVSRSTLDLPTELTSSSGVNIGTRSGENDLHGEAFGLFRGKDGSAALPGSSSESFQREQYGARVGGALIKNKVLWFLAGERIQQNLTAAEPFSAPFDVLGTALSRPFHEFMADGRLDWQRRDNAHAFYRFTFDQPATVGPFGANSSLQGLRQATHSPSHTLGYDFTRGLYTHSLRFEYLRMSTGIGDDSPFIPAGIDNPVPGLGISIGAPVSGNCGLSQSGAYCAGPSPFAPQKTIQSSYLVRYDGSRIWTNHVFRFGVTYDRIQGGGFSSLFLSPQVGTAGVCLPGSISSVCLTSADPTAYPADFAFLGNGSGFSTSSSAFGFPGGELGPDNRLEAYVGDNWRYTRNLVISLGLRYSRETGRVDHDLPFAPALNDWQPGLANAVRSPNTDFGPQAGVAWDVGGFGKTVLRAGGGIYYDTSLWSNMMLDARARSKNGMLTYTPQVCANGNPTAFTWPTSLAAFVPGSSLAGGAAIVRDPSTGQVVPTFCGSTIAGAADPILALSSAFQAAASSAGTSQPNPNYIGNALSAVNVNGLDVFGPDFRTPRVIQMNAGFQTEITKGTVLSVDYVRTIGTHNLLITDQNHSGAARSYNFQNAIAARDAAQLSSGCPIGLGQAPCMVNNLGSVAAAQAAYSAAGLDSNSATAGGGPCSFCAFPGYTPLGVNLSGSGGGNGSLGTLNTLSTIGRSVYWGAQGRLVQRFSSPSHGIKTANLQIAYSFSKFVSQSPDQNFATPATNNDDPLQFTGPNGMDRKHQVAFGGTFELPWLTHLSVFGRFFSPLAETLRLPELTHGGEIFASDWLGSGLASGGLPEPVQGTGLGQFMRSTDIDNLQTAVSNYNTRFAGGLTPAGHCLVADAGCPGTAPIVVMTSSDMSALGWVLPTLPSVTPHAIGAPWLKTLDFRLYWPIKVGDRVTVEPSASAFNIFNFANAFLPGTLAGSSMYPGPNPALTTNGILAPSVIGGITGATLTPFRSGLQSGTFATGSPRQLEFGLRISF